MYFELEIEGPPEEVESVASDFEAFARQHDVSVRRGDYQPVPRSDRSGSGEILGLVAIVLALPGAIHDGIELYRRWCDRNRERIQREHPRVSMREATDSDS